MDENFRPEPERKSNWFITFFRHIKLKLEIVKIWKLLNLMVFMLIFGFSMSLKFSFRDNLIYQQLCKDRFHEDYSSCYEVKDRGNISDANFRILEVVHTSSTHVFAMIGLKIIFECLSSSFLCSWSDSCGRKFPLLIAILGQYFDLSSFFLRDFSFVYFIWALYIFTALSGLFGGNVCIFTMSYCYLSDCFPREYRALTFTMIDFTYVLGLISGVIAFKKLIVSDTLLASFLVIFVVRCVLLIWMLLTFYDRNFDLKDAKLKKKISELFSIMHLKKIYEAISRWRSNCEREQLLLIILSAVPVMVAHSLIPGVIYTTNLHSKLFLSFEHYEEITAYFAFYACLAEPIAIVIYQNLSKFKDSTLGIIGFWNLYLSSFILAFSLDHLTFIVGLILSPLKGFAVVALRSAYSKIAGENERGKLFYLYASSEVLSMFFGHLLYLKLSRILTEKEEILPYMIMGTALIMSFCTFMFEAISIHVGHLFEKCYRNVPFRTASAELNNASTPSG